MTSEPIPRYFPAAARLVITNACPFKCPFCFQEGYPTGFRQQLLSVDDYVRVIGVLISNYRLKKVKLTGGEPLSSPDHFNLLIALRCSFPELEIGVTTNGILATKLQRILDTPELKSVRINISLHAVRRPRLRALTGHNNFRSLFKSIVYAARRNPDNIKLNCLYLPGEHERDAIDVIQFANRLGITVKLLSLHVNLLNESRLDERMRPYTLQRVSSLVEDTRNSANLMSLRATKIQIVQCSESDPVRYYKRFKTVRLYFDGRLGITGDSDGFCRGIDAKQPEEDIDSLVADITARCTEQAQLPNS